MSRLLFRLPTRLIGVTAGVLAVVVPAPVDAAPDDDVPFTSPNGDFSVVFPSAPVDVSDQVGATSGAATEMSIFLATDGDLVYLAGTFEMPVGGEPTAAELAETTDEFMQGLGGGELTYSAPIEFRGAPGLEVAAIPDPEQIDGSLFGRMIFVHRDVYMVFVIGERSSISMKDPEVAAFVGSFDFVKDAF